MKHFISISILAAAFCVSCGSSSSDSPKEKDTVTVSSSTVASNEVAAQPVVSQAQQVDNPDSDLGVYLDGQVKGEIKIMDAAKSTGKVVLTLPDQSVCQFLVNGVSNEWWFVASKITMIDPEEKQLELPDGGWINASALAVSTRNYGGQKLSLRDMPEAGSKELYSFTEEAVLKPVDMSGDWVKVKTTDGAHEGWIEAEMLCGSAVTNCN